MKADIVTLDGLVHTRHNPGETIINNAFKKVQILNRIETSIFLLFKNAFIDEKSAYSNGKKHDFNDEKNAIFT